jgi:hypothetical protein
MRIEKKREGRKAAKQKADKAALVFTASCLLFFLIRTPQSKIHNRQLFAQIFTRIDQIIHSPGRRLIGNLISDATRRVGRVFRGKHETEARVEEPVGIHDSQHDQSFAWREFIDSTADEVAHEDSFWIRESKRQADFISTF